MNFFQILSFVKMAMPIITIAIKKVEEAIPGESEGEQKLAAVREFLESVFNEEGFIDTIWPLLSIIISGKVAELNITKGFDVE